MAKSKIITKIRLRHVLVGAFFSAIFVISLVWFLAPSLAEWGLNRIAQNTKAATFGAEVNRLNPWETRIEKIVFEREEAEVSIDNLLIQYEPQALALGQIHSFTLRELDVNVDGKKMLDHLLQEQHAEQDSSEEMWLNKVGEFLSDPNLKHLRILDSALKLEWPDFSLPINFDVKGDYDQGLARTTFDGDFAEFPFLSEIRFWDEDGNTYAGIEIEFSDLNKSEKLKYPFLRFTGVNLGEELSVESGDLVMQGIGRIDGNNITDQFMEFNGSNISGNILDVPFAIEKVISFVTPENLGRINFQNYANLVIPEIAEIKGFALGVELKDQNLTIRSSIQEIKVLDSFGAIKITGMSFPVVDLDLSDLEKLPINQPHDLFFDSVQIEEGAISLDKGKLNLLWNKELNLLRTQVFPLDATLVDLNIRLIGLSYNGLMEISDPFPSDFDHIFSCEKAFLGEDSLVENLTLSFRPLGPQKVLINNMTAKLSGIFTDISPANCTLSILEEMNGYKIDFNNTDIRLGREKVVLEGLNGSILVKSFDPLVTAEKNILSFRKLTTNELELEDGNFSLSVNNEGEFVVSDLFLRIFDGTMEMESAKWKLYTDYIKVESMLDEVSGQQIVDFFERLDVQIDGNFSGMVSFSNYDGIWDFGTGFLQLNPSDKANIKFNQGDLIYSGIDPTDPQAKNLKLTAWAMEDLEVDGMRVNFKVLENERQVIISINGVRETKDQKVDLDYRPRFLGGLQDLLQWKENLNIPR